MPDSEIKFATDRTRRLRANELKAADEDTIANIEKFGCSVVHVRGSDNSLGWSYTIGIYDTCGQPEIVTVGLPVETAHALLNNAADALRAHVNLGAGRHSDMVGDVDCEFRPVDSKWVKHLLLWADWYYDRADFPVLQAVYPDLQNHFPEDEGFEEYFRQPLLQPDAPMTRVEKDFWASADPESSLFNWKFPDPPHTMVYLSKTVHEGQEEITYVSHDVEDGAWQFLGDTMTESGGVISCFHHPIDKDPTLAELADLPPGWYAQRETPNAPWTRHQQDSEETEEEIEELDSSS